jgi:Divergent InlB B-repeat domain
MYREGFSIRSRLARLVNIGLPLVICGAAQVALGLTVTLAWDPSVSSGIAGYKVYYGASTGQYTNSIATAGTSLTVSNLLDGQTYYFAATAFDSFGVESDFSAETNYVPVSGKPPETAPVITAIGTQTLSPGAVAGPLPFTIGDAESAPNALTVTATSSDKTFIPDANIMLSGSGSNRAVTVTPAQSSGSATVTLTVSDGTLSSSSAFLVSVQSGTPSPNPSIDVTTVGDGTVTPATSSMVQGRTYTLTAKPGKNQVFAGWSGDLSSTTPRLKIKFDHAIHLHASFIPNPFIPVSGKYAGLFFETNGVELNSAGGLAVMVNPRGNYSGRFQIGPNRYAFSGKLTLDLQGSNTLQRGVAPAVTVEFRLGTNDESDQLFGHLSGNGWVADLSGDRSVFNARTNPAPQAGLYTILLPSQSSGSTMPEGHSFGTVKVNPNGTINFAGSLADGTRASQSAPISKFGTWPMAVMLYGGQGSLISWLKFTNDTATATDINGRLSWIKSSMARTRMYPSGFAMQTAAIGSVYARPATALDSVLTFTQGNLDLGGGNLAGETNVAVNVLANKILAADGVSAKLTFAPGNGLFRGTVPDPVTGKYLRVSGVAFQKQNLAAGMISGLTETGWAMLTAAP